MEMNAQELSERLSEFNAKVVEFVQNCSDEGWAKQCDAEEWSVGVTARHIGAGHYGAIELARRMVAGEPLPALTMEQLIEMANAHAREHAGCTRDEVLAILREKGAEMISFVAALDEADLARTAHMDIFGGEVSVGKLLETIILNSAGEHLTSIQAAAQT